MFKSLQGGEDLDSGIVLDRLVDLFEAQDLCEKAAQVGEKLYEARRKSAGDDAEQSLDMSSEIGLFYLRCCKFSEAKHWFKTLVSSDTKSAQSSVKRQMKARGHVSENGLLKFLFRSSMIPRSIPKLTKSGIPTQSKNGKDWHLRLLLRLISKIHDNITLTTAGVPVVILVESQYPILAGVKPPLDPHPMLIDPAQPLEDGVVEEILEIFPFAEGFYLLLNGMLQIMVVKEFDYEEAASHLPNSFDGLESVGSQTEDIAPSYRPFITFLIQDASHTIPCFTMNNSNHLAARIRTNPRPKNKFAGCIGLHVKKEDSVTRASKHYLTVASRVVRKATLQKEHDSFFRRIVGEGIVKNRRETNKGLSSVAKCVALASRCILYRAAPPFKKPSSFSGMALYVDPYTESPDSSDLSQNIIREDGTCGPAVIGFQSFAQPSNFNAEWELEGKDFDHEVEQGYTSFYGTFQVPEELRQEYEIL
ncbi:hypothetical protein P154DRAFT_531492 [Amniculicola lignicola CBS 123094]|uniref:Uncharacterized protein n=1 Tax=Amniculicola lignicola CBS 123094 TaxID=1392246 RepID=A0A6A5WS64_9PLEO|nr:hypothetical protein P154DRAFT_531492 [Amniculicola lignicola CBS 123094]